MIMKGYHNLPKETAAALTPDHYFKTGDLGMMDTDGFVFITGRKKDLIIVAGEKAAPREIEGDIDGACGGGGDGGGGEKRRCMRQVGSRWWRFGNAVAKEGQEVKGEALRDFCKEAGLAQWKIPKEFYFQKELPHSPTGKVLKRVLMEQVNQTPAEKRIAANWLVSGRQWKCSSASPGDRAIVVSDNAADRSLATCAGW